MKKALVLIAAAFTLTFCNPSQQADQTTDTTSMMTDTTSSMSTDTTAMMDTTSTMKDTTNLPDSLPR